MIELTIPSGGTQSSAAPIGYGQLIALIWPATMTSTTATIQTSADDGGTWHTVRTVAGTANYEIPITASAHQPLEPTVVYSIGGLLMRVVVGSAEGAARTVRAVMAAL